MSWPAAYFGGFPGHYISGREEIRLYSSPGTRRSLGEETLAFPLDPPAKERPAHHEGFVDEVFRLLAHCRLGRHAADSPALTRILFQQRNRRSSLRGRAAGDRPRRHRTRWRRARGMLGDVGRTGGDLWPPRLGSLSCTTGKKGPGLAGNGIGGIFLPCPFLHNALGRHGGRGQCPGDRVELTGSRAGCFQRGWQCLRGPAGHKDLKHHFPFLYELTYIAQ